MPRSDKQVSLMQINGEETEVTHLSLARIALSSSPKASWFINLTTRASRLSMHHLPLLLRQCVRSLKAIT